MVGSVRIWKVLAIALFSTIIPLTLGFDEDIDVESWVSKSQLFPTDPLEYVNVRKSILAMPDKADDMELFGARRANPPSISSRSRVELGPGMFKSAILRYPPKYFQNKLKHLITLQNRQDQRSKLTPKKNSPDKAELTTKKN